MNLLLVRPEEVHADGTVRLDGRRARHLLEVLRVAVGDRIAAGVLGGRTGLATVLGVSSGGAHPVPALELALELGGEPPPPSGIDVLMALPRPKVLRRSLRHLASLGVKRIVLVNAARVEKSYFASPLLDPARTAEELVLGLEQARDTVLPTVLVRERFRPFVEDEAEALWPRPTRRLVAHPSAERLLDPASTATVATPIVVAIGPEGGFVPFEMALLESAGFAPFSIGPRALPVEAAVVAVVAAAALLRSLPPVPSD